MPVESEKKDVLTKNLEHLPSRKKIILTIPQTHPHNLPNTTSNPSRKYSAHAIGTLTSDFIARTPNW
jgi:hypothetical protein